MHRTKKYLALGVTVAVTLGLASCSSEEDGPGLGGSADVATQGGLVVNGELIADAELFEAAKDQTLTLYTSYQESSEAEFLKAFTHDTGIKVDMVRLVPAQLAERTLTEAGANKLPADVIRISDFRFVQQMEEAGVWQDYVPPTSEGLEDEIIVDNGMVAKVLHPVFTFSYNTNLVTEAEAPKSWMDLTDPKWAGSVSIIRGTGGGVMDSFNMFAETELDPGYWDALAAQEPIIYDGGLPAVDAIAKGEVKVGHSGTANVNIMVTNSGAPLQYVIPEEGLVTFDYYLGIAGSSKNIEAAKVFSNYNLSKRGQSVIASMGDYSVRKDVEPPTSLGMQLPALDSGKVWRSRVEDPSVVHAAREEWATAFGY